VYDAGQNGLEWSPFAYDLHNECIKFA
jgi:hypothetical protein